MFFINVSFIPIFFYVFLEFIKFLLFEIFIYVLYIIYEISCLWFLISSHFISFVFANFRSSFIVIVFKLFNYFLQQTNFCQSCVLDTSWIFSQITISKFNYTYLNRLK